MSFHVVELSAERSLLRIHGTYDDRARAADALYDAARTWASAEVGERHCSVLLDAQSRQRDLQQVSDGLLLRYGECGEGEYACDILKCITIDEKSTQQISGWLSTSEDVALERRRVFALVQGAAPQLSSADEIRQKYVDACIENGDLALDLERAQVFSKLRESEITKLRARIAALKETLALRDENIARVKAKAKGLRAKLQRAECELRKAELEAGRAEQAPARAAPAADTQVIAIDFSQVLAEMQRKFDERADTSV